MSETISPPSRAPLALPHRTSPLAVLFLLFTVILPARADEPWSARPEVVAKFEQRNAERGTAFLYDEGEVPDYALPDPLVSPVGEKVRSAEAWRDERRQRVLEAFRSHVYGRRPDRDFEIAFERTAERGEVFEGAAIGREMAAIVSIGDRSFRFPFVVFLPTAPARPVPTVVHINNRYYVPLEKTVAEHDPFWPVRTLVERGYATASFHTSHVDPDRRDGYPEGIRAFFADGAEPEPDAWRSLSAWGWAASRVLDYLLSLDPIDPDRVAVSGHSRGGKASLWAAAEDPRFAIAYSNDSGCGGAALSRRAYGETVARITTMFPHWFVPAFATFGDRVDELPVDQHQLVGLIAPRAVYVASADEDLWADPRGEYTSLVAAAPVFRLLGEKSITDPEMPPLDHPRIEGRTGYHVRSGGHDLTDRDWGWFLDFANSQWDAAATVEP